MSDSSRLQIAKNHTRSVKTAQVKDEIEQVTEHAILGLKEAFQLENRVVGEKEYLEPIKGCELKYNTRPDYCHRVDLKTKCTSFSLTIITTTIHRKICIYFL